ncbi:MAG TPA: 3-hydroxyacyl-CoA dehydrogenase family protein, partial [Mobilitalea sp.]|nr:3-hydroxyacyl-CoA dehydrogenase family protein [Mobilitalea sp.]
GCNLSGIFASFGKAKVFMICRSKEKAEKAVEEAIKSVRAEAIRPSLIPLDYDDLKDCVPSSDLVLECVAEEYDVKKETYRLIHPFLRDHTIIASVTSGLSIQLLSEVFEEKYRKNYLGLHFFNPPYHMSLCEVIPSTRTSRDIKDNLKGYLKEVLYRKVVEVKDQPAFLGNRIGFQFINEALQYAEQYKEFGGIDYIDSILGQYTGRSMAPIVTADFVGLDIHKSIVDNLYDNTDDFARNTFLLPQFVKELVREGRLGRKVGEGFYKTMIDGDGVKHRYVYDIKSMEYRKIIQYHFPFSEQMIEKLANGDYIDAMHILESSKSTEAQICLYFLVKYITYSISIAMSVSDSLHDADDVMAAGFNWIPPLSLIKALGGSVKYKELTKSLLGIELTRIDIPDSLYDYRSFLKAKH